MAPILNETMTRYNTIKDAYNKVSKNFRCTVCGQPVDPEWPDCPICGSTSFN